MRRLRFLIQAAFLLITASVSSQYITVDDSYTAQQLVEDVLVNSSCASVSNFSVSGGDFGNGVQSYGYFSGAGTTFPFQDGIILSTGKAVKAEGPNNSLLDDGNNMNWGEDTDLEQALGINNSINATVLEFDFVPLADKISFNYMLASEEYHDTAPCQYSDGFAFLLKEANTNNAYQNLAVIPGTNIPVKVTSVHPDIPGGCPAENPEYFDAFNGVEYPTNFNGQTKVMQAQANVIPGVQYHIKLVIADEGNYRYDSAIFIGGGSFEVVTDLGPDRLVAADNPVCEGDTVLLDATNPNADAYQWYKDGTLLAGETNAQYTVTSAGDYSVEVQLNQTCLSNGEVTIEYTSLPPVNNTTLLQCDDDNDGLTVFNLNLAADDITNSNPDLSVTGYYTTLNNAESGTSPITNTTAFENTTPNQQVYARVENQFGCHSVSTITLATAVNGLTDPDPMAQCDDDGTEDGLIAFDLTQRDSQILQNLPPGLGLDYYTTMADAFAATNPIPDPANYTNTVPGGQTVYARVHNGSECYGITELQLIVYTFGDALDDENVFLCSGFPLTLNAGNGFTSYKWDTTPPKMTQAIIVNETGDYSVTVTNTNGCEGTKTFHVGASGRPEDAAIDINDFNGDNNSVTVTPSGPGDYEYSLDGVHYQDSPVFNNLEEGEYTLYINDKNGCGPVYTTTIYILDYPKFFTPNADGINETWRIPLMNKRPGIQVTVFDRYGKILDGFTGNAPGWDGTYNGHRMPADDYWFVIQLENGRKIKGHFALIR